jgi:acetyl esterase/lipase
MKRGTDCLQSVPLLLYPIFSIFIAKIYSMQYRKFIVQPALLLTIITFLFFSCKKNNDNTGGGNTNTTTPELILKDVAYSSHLQQKMDVYLPAGRSDTGRAKVIVVVHGGGWGGGDKSEMEVIVALMRQKWPQAAVVNINYRLVTPTFVGHPNQLNDIRAALDFLVTKQAEYKIATQGFALAGASAGAHLSLLYGYAFDPERRVKVIGDAFGPTNFLDIPWYNNILAKPTIEGYMGKTLAQDTALYRSASPLERVTATSPPTIIFHGSQDIIVPVQQSVLLDAKLQSFGVRHIYQNYPTANHGWDGALLDDTVTKMIAFFKEYL